jgi:hypothetical protein
MKLKTTSVGIAACFSMAAVSAEPPSRSGAAPELYESSGLELRPLGRQRRRELEERDPTGGRPTFAYSRYGNPVNGGDDRGAKWTVYRFHTDSPVVFQQDIKVGIEHGHANHRSDNLYTVAYWYQTEPHRAFPPLPAASERIPRQYDTGGPTMGRP